MIPATILWKDAQEPLLVRLHALDNLDGESWFVTTDAGKVPGAKLVELGIPLAYAIEPGDWPAQRPDNRIAVASYPNMRTVAGQYTAEQVWRAVPAFFDTYKTPQAMVNALRLAALYREPYIVLPEDGSEIAVDDGGDVVFLRRTGFGTQVRRVPR